MGKKEDIIEEIKKEEVDTVAADKKAAAAALIGKKLNASLDFNKFNESNKSLDVSKECENVAEEICEASGDIVEQDDEDLSSTVDFSKQSSFVMDFESSFREKGINNGQKNSLTLVVKSKYGMYIHFDYR